MTRLELALPDERYQPCIISQADRVRGEHLQVLAVPDIELPLRTETEGKLPSLLYKTHVQIAKKAAEILGYEEESRECHELEEFSFSAMKADYMMTAGQMGPSCYFAAMMMELSYRMDKGHLDKLLLGDKRHVDIGVDRLTKILHSRQIKEIFLESKKAYLQIFPEELEATYVKLPTLETMWHVWDMRKCSLVGNEKAIEILRLDTKESQFAGMGYLTWLVAKLDRAKNIDVPPIDEKEMEFVESCVTVLYNLGAAEQGSLNNKHETKIFEESWPRGLILFRDKLTSIMAPAAYELGNRVLGETTGIRKDSYRLFILSYCDYLHEMIPRLWGEIDNKKAVTVASNFKGVWGSIAKVLLNEPEIHNKIIKTLEKVRIGDGIEPDDASKFDKRSLNASLMIRNLDILLQSRDLIMADPAQNQLPEAKAFIEEVNIIQCQIEKKLREIPDLGRMLYCLDPEQWESFIKECYKENISVRLLMTRTTGNGKTAIERDQSIRPDELLPEEIKATMADWMGAEPQTGKFAALFIRGMYKGKVPIEVQLVPQELWQQSRDAHGIYRE